VFGDFGSDVRRAVIYLFDLMDRGTSAYVGIERTLGLTLEAGVMMPLTLDLKICHVVGRVDMPVIAGRIAEVLHDQAMSDLFSLQSSLSEFSGDILIRFRGPAELLEFVRQVVDEDWSGSVDAVRHEKSSHRILSPEFIEEELQPDQDSEAPARGIFQRLAAATRIDLDSVYDAAEDALEDSVNVVEVLRFVEGETRWVDFEVVEDEETNEPFWLLRAWGDGGPLPVVYSTVSGRSVSWDGWSPQELVTNFSYTLATLADEKKYLPLRMKGVEQLRDAAEKLFMGANIKIAPIGIVVLDAENEDVIFGDDLMEEGGTPLEHLGLCADPNWEPLLSEEGWELSRNSDFLVAVHDDLRQNASVKGAEIILARFLSTRALNLLG
ncbi:hypothetical protein P7L87_26445, partial [Vibrio parahaemolyticus]|nr:hypothetical protein [Vibrio parahaemolyticus]